MLGLCIRITINDGSSVHRGFECPLPGSIQGQAGWGCEQPGPEGGVPAYGRGLELDDLKGPFQPKSSCDFGLRSEARLRKSAILVKEGEKI